MTLRTDKDLKSNSTKLPDGPWVDHIHKGSQCKKIGIKAKKNSD